MSALPRFGEVSVVEGQVCVVEARLPGRNLASFLGRAEGEARARVLGNYMAAAGAIGRIGVVEAFFGELLAEAPVQRATWTDFLKARVRAALTDEPTGFARQAPEAAALALARFDALANALAPIERPCLVHGDFWSANLMVDEAGEVAAVIDFGVQTLMGDPLMDVVSAVLNVKRPADRALAEAAARAAHPGFDQALPLYELYYALYYVDGEDNGLRDWCLRTLTAVV